MIPRHPLPKHKSRKREKIEIGRKRRKEMLVSGMESMQSDLTICAPTS